MRPAGVHAPIRALAAGLVVLGLFGCSKTPAEFPVPPTGAAPVLPSATPAIEGDTSVPSASSVFAPAPAASVDPAAGRANKPMSQAQESTAMPMPGQNNDHSAPLTPAKPASAP